MEESERIETLLRYFGVSARALAGKMGLKSPQVFYDIRSGKCGLSKEVSRKLLEVLPEVNPSWLLTGEGKMLRSQQESDGSRDGIISYDELLTSFKVLEKETELQREQISDLKSQIDFLKFLLNK